MRTAIDVVLAKPVRTPQQLEATAEKVRRSIDRAEPLVDALLTLAVSNQGVGEVGPVDLVAARPVHDGGLVVLVTLPGRPGLGEARVASDEGPGEPVGPLAPAGLPAPAGPAAGPEPA
jgi:hypothetical protein